MGMVIDDWTSVADRLPDDDKLVLMAFGDSEVWPGFRDAGVWRDTTAMPVVPDRVTHWMDMPPAPQGISA